MNIPTEFSVLNELNSKLFSFVKKSTEHFDDSHNHEHAYQVVSNSLDIIKHDELIQKKLEIYPIIPELVLIVGWLHDVRDHKYSESISQEQLETFIKSLALESTHSNQICKIIENISWSKEAKGLRQQFDEPYSTVLDIVSDGDRLEAIGKIGITRCEIYTREKGGRVPQDVIIHCQEKLLRILPEGFIRTTRGKFLATPLHQEIVDYVQSHK